MAKRRGRPSVEDKRNNQYRVLMNDMEDRMLAYCSRLTGLPKSQIFRKGVEAYYQQVLLNEYGKSYGQDYDGHISLKRVVECPHCGAGLKVDFGEEFADVTFDLDYMSTDTECPVCEGEFVLSVEWMPHYEAKKVD
jgi:hypothetical protein